ncbi:HD-GYP domain-containing protein [Desulfocurvus sp. DL9XJH121]
MPERILFVDDDTKILTSIRRMLGRKYDIVTATSAKEGLSLIATAPPFALVISDIRMAGMDGLKFLAMLRKNDPQRILMVLTGYADLENALSAVNNGHVFRILSKPITQQDLEKAIDDGLRQRRLLLDQQEIVFLRRLKDAMEGIITGFGILVEARDPYTAGHQRNVTGLAVAIAETMGMSHDHIQGLRLAAGVHDIGKLYVPAEFLNRPGRLTPEELAIIKAHPNVGYSILSPVEFPWPIAEMVRQHHERLDGGGYPLGLSGDDILPESRILAVADVVDAINSHRPYRPGKGINAAMAEIRTGSGIIYDRDAVRACIKVFEEDRFTLAVTEGSPPYCDWLCSGLNPPP